MKCPKCNGKMDKIGIVVYRNGGYKMTNYDNYFCYKRECTYEFDVRRGKIQNENE